MEVLFSITVGVIVFPKVKKRIGMQDEDVLHDPYIKQNIVDKFFGAYFVFYDRLFPAKKKETINVFSVASGHLYERFLSIMMLSVKEKTQSPVKFWIIENFLSPSFIEFLPHLSKAYDFEYELVTC